jgi:hypothetical protein
MNGTFLALEMGAVAIEVGVPTAPISAKNSDQIHRCSEMTRCANSCRDAEWCCWFAVRHAFGYVASNRAILISLV